MKELVSAEPRAPGSRHCWRPMTCLAIVFFWILALASVASAQRLLSPTRIAEGAPGQLLVSDYAAEAIFVVDKQSLAVLWVIPIKGKPMGVARLGSQMFVGNEKTQSVEVYDVNDAKRRAKLSSTLGAALGGTGPGSFKRPTDIAIDPATGLILVLDLGDQLVKVFDTAGNFVNSFKPAIAGKPVSFVAAIAVDSVRQEILVTDHGDPNAGIPARIVVFTYSGQYQRLINGDGYVDNAGTLSTLQFARPQGLVADGAAHIFMVDPVLGKMIMFDENNILDADSIAVVKRLDGFQGCTDLVIDSSSGDLFAVNNKRATVVVSRGEAGIQ